MAYIKASFLRQQANDRVNESAAVRMEARASATFSRAKRVFLSHSHKDKDLAHGLRNYLLSLQVELYIDWLDSSMPPTPNRETAQKIKQKINSSQHVLVLATRNALESKWVPWEIGIADSNKGPTGITLIPVVEDNEAYSGNEYLQLYRHVEISSSGRPAVFEINASNGMLVESWLGSL